MLNEENLMFVQIYASAVWIEQFGISMFTTSNYKLKLKHMCY